MGRSNRRKANRTSVDSVRAVWGSNKAPDSELIAIDPGDRWTGVAFFATNDDGDWYCQDAVELGREEFEDGFAELILREELPPGIVIYERWRLYEDHVNNQKGKEFEASQIIGVIKYVVRCRNEHVARHAEAQASGKMMTCELAGGMCHERFEPVYPIELVGQMADIKKPTTGILRHKKIKSVAKPIAKANYEGRDHVVDAELHGWKHILDAMGGSAAS